MSYLKSVKKHSSPVILLMLLISLLLNGYFVVTATNESKNSDIVAKIVDGDTFILGSGERVRLLGVNAPEQGRCFFEEAKEELSELLLQKVVLIKEERRDNFGRRMGLVYQDGLLINTRMIEEGFAKPDYTKNSVSELFIKAYDAAKEKNLGVNSSICKKTSEVSPPDLNCTIKGNIDKATGDKFYHLPHCRQYNQIVLDLDVGEGYFCTEKQAQEEGFVKSQGCER